MKNNLLVTLADKNYLAQAKQLFSSVYHNSGWQGDYMLLAHGLSDKDLRWFRKKGILIKKVKPFIANKELKNIPLAYTLNWNSAVLMKLNLFTPYFKKWKNIVYLDADIIVRASLDSLTKIKGFAAARDYIPKFKGNFLLDKNIKSKEFKEKYPLKSIAFNSGVMAFNTKVITSSTPHKIRELLLKYKEINLWGDQGILNLYFYHSWKELPRVYNAYLLKQSSKKDLLKAIVVHDIGSKKMWERKSPICNEWENNLKKAELINLKNRPKAKETWSFLKVTYYDFVLKLKYFLYFLKTHPDPKSSIFNKTEKALGQAGKTLRLRLPRIYTFLKNSKDAQERI